MLKMGHDGMIRSFSQAAGCPPSEGGRAEQCSRNSVVGRRRVNQGANETRPDQTREEGALPLSASFTTFKFKKLAQWRRQWKWTIQKRRSCTIERSSSRSSSSSSVHESSDWNWKRARDRWSGSYENGACGVESGKGWIGMVSSECKRQQRRAEHGSRQTLTG